jgi:hypothetical protein
MTKEEFIKVDTEKYGDKYDYSMVTEHGLLYGTNIPIKCYRHGLFWTTPYMHLHGIIPGCFECYKEENWGNKEGEL